MVNISLENFYSTILSDSSLQDQLKSTTDQSSFANLMVKLGTERGYQFTAQDVETAITQELKTQLQELKDEDLAIVSGGRPRATSDGCDSAWTTLFGPC